MPKTSWNIQPCLDFAVTCIQTESTKTAADAASVRFSHSLRWLILF